MKTLNNKSYVSAALPPQQEGGFHHEPIHFLHRLLLLGIVLVQYLASFLVVLQPWTLLLDRPKQQPENGLGLVGKFLPLPGVP